MEVINKKIDLWLAIQKINTLARKCTELHTHYTYEDKDVRKVIFVLLRNELQYFMTSIMLSKRLKEKSFYKEQYLKTDDIDKEFLQISLDNHISSVSNAYYFLMFIHVENYIRLIAHNKGWEAFSINNTFKKIATEYDLCDEKRNLFQIVLNIRNSSHNGGFFSHTDIDIEYKNINYEFRKDKPIHLPFVQIENNIFLTEGLISLIECLNNKTSSETFIEHNYSKLNFIYEQ